MNLDQIHYFLSVVNQGSINKASVAMAISQQSLSSSIKSLEEELGVVLFKRGNKGVSLTKEGEVFYTYAINAWQNYRDMQTDLHPKKLADGEKRCRLRVGVVDAFTSTFFPPFTIDFVESHPYIDLKMYNLTHEEIEERLLHDDLDFGVVFRTKKGGEILPEIEPGLESRELVQCRGYCWVSTKSPLAQQQSVSLVQMAKGPMIVRGEVDMNFIDFFYDEYEINIFDFPLINSDHMIAQAVSHNMAILPDIKIGSKPLIMDVFFQNLPVVAIPSRLPSYMGVYGHILGKSKSFANENFQSFINGLSRYVGLQSE